MKVTNTTGVDRWVPAVGATVADGETVDIDATAGRSLVEQGWTSPKSTTTKAATQAEQKES